MFRCLPQLLWVKLGMSIIPRIWPTEWVMSDLFAAHSHILVPVTSVDHTENLTVSNCTISVEFKFKYPMCHELRDTLINPPIETGCWSPNHPIQPCWNNQSIDRQRRPYKIHAKQWSFRDSLNALKFNVHSFRLKVATRSDISNYTKYGKTFLPRLTCSRWQNLWDLVKLSCKISQKPVDWNHFKL